MIKKSYRPITVIKSINSRLSFLCGSLAAALIIILSAAMWMPAAGAVKNIPAPGPGFYVLDQAGVISQDTQTMIINTSQELHRLTKAQVAVVTLKTLNNQPIEDVSLAILRQWQLGDKKLNNGLLILVVPTERQSRIEVGYGLEGALPDAKTGRIQDEYMLPSFKQGDYDRGIRNGYLQIVKDVAGEYGVKLDIQAPDQSTGDQAPAQQPAEQHLPGWAIILIVIGILFLAWIDDHFFDGFILGFLLSLLFRGGGGGFGGGGFGGRGDSGGGGSGGGGGSSRGW